jgi:hypothetical protein
MLHLRAVKGFATKYSFSFRPPSSTTKTFRYDSCAVKLGSVVEGLSEQQQNDSNSNNNEPLTSNTAKRTAIQEKMQQISNIASMLCVVDCTVLPIVTVLLPLLGIATTTTSAATVLHDIGHAISLYFVLPGKILLLFYKSFSV